MERQNAERLARGILTLARAGLGALPAPLRDRLERRLFYAIFNLTRATNDAYGWRPPAPGGSPPPRGEE